MLDRAAKAARTGGVDWAKLKKGFAKPVGCDQCYNLGYRWRTCISEVLEVTPQIAAAVSNRASAAEIRALAIKQGMVTIAADGVRRAANGETSLQEVARVTNKMM